MHFIIEVRYITHINEVSSHHTRIREVSHMNTGNNDVSESMHTCHRFIVLSLVSGQPVLQKVFFPSLTNIWFSASCVQLERCWVTCSRCPESDERTTSSTRASLSTRIFCNATTCRPPLHLEDIRPLQPSSSWPLGSTRCSHIVRISYYFPASVKNRIWKKCYD